MSVTLNQQLAQDIQNSLMLEQQSNKKWGISSIALQYHSVHLSLMFLIIGCRR